MDHTSEVSRGDGLDPVGMECGGLRESRDRQTDLAAKRALAQRIRGILEMAANRSDEGSDAQFN